MSSNRSSIQISLVFVKTRLRITKVDDVHEMWEGVLDIYSHYYYPEDGAKDSSVAGKDITVVEKPAKSPEFAILKDERSSLTEQFYFRCPEAPNTMFSFHEFTVCLHERLELQRFPFDRQNFSFEFECRNAELAPWSLEHIPKIITDSLGMRLARTNFIGQCDTESWELNRLILSQSHARSVKIKMGMTRLTGFYLNNIVFPVFLIVQIATLTCAIEPELYGDRFSCMLTLLLTIVAFKFVTSTFVPRIDYQTLLDVYTSTAYIFLFLWLLQIFFVSPFFDVSHSTAVDLDKGFGALYTVAWVSLHVFIVVGSYKRIFQKSWKEVDCDDVATREGTQIGHTKIE